LHCHLAAGAPQEIAVVASGEAGTVGVPLAATKRIAYTRIKAHLVDECLVNTAPE
jgi:hypothetical protein